jgi:hypothetical protein
MMYLLICILLEFEKKNITADLCSSVTSDGVIIDSSPPTVGVVQDGVEVYDTHYQSMRYICL